jgi:arylsulfatase A-like enzyme
MPDPLRNILVILTDQHRASAAGFAGDPHARTPHLDALAGRSTCFSRAYTPAPVCVPARQSLITGRYPHAHGAINNGSAMNSGEVTIGHLAAGHGMATGAIGKMHFVGPDRHQGFAARWDYEDYAAAEPEAAGDAASGMAYKDRYGVRSPGNPIPILPDTNPLDRAYWSGPSPFPAERHVESYITREAVRFLEDHRHERFLLVCSYFKPHDPMMPPREYWEQVAGATFAPPVPPAPPSAPPSAGPEDAGIPQTLRRMQRALGVEEFDEGHWQDAVRGYYGNLAFVDGQIGAVLGTLDALGLRDDTLVIYTSDHGEYAGAAAPPVGRLAGKSSFYEAAWRVPLLLSDPRTPRIAEGKTSDALASLVDLFPTIAAAAGLPSPDRRHGISLLPAASGAPGTGDGNADARDHVFGELHGRFATRPHCAVRAGDWKLARYEPGEEYLFNLRDDPAEAHNRAAEEPARVAELEALLAHDAALD